MVSVIVPTYNRKEILKKAIDSILAQSYHDFEIIIVDDFSEDCTEEYIRKYFESELSDKKISFFRNSSNMDKSYSRNFGVKKARGEYLAFLDDDDLWLKDHLKEGVLFIKDHPDLDVLFTNFVIHRGEERIYPNNDIKTGSGKVYRDFCISGKLGCSCAVLVKKTAFDRVQGYDEKFSVYEDRHFFARIAIDGNVGFLNKATAVINNHSDSYSYAKGFLGMALEKERVVNDILKIVDESNYLIEKELKEEIYFNLAFSFSGGSLKAFEYLLTSLFNNFFILFKIKFWKVFLRSLVINK